MYVPKGGSALRPIDNEEFREQKGALTKNHSSTKDTTRGGHWNLKSGVGAVHPPEKRQRFTPVAVKPDYCPRCQLSIGELRPGGSQDRDSREPKRMRESTTSKSQKR